jgi:hypothetical protein
VDDFLEFSYANWFATMPNDGDHLIAFQKDKEGKLVFDARYKPPRRSPGTTITIRRRGSTISWTSPNPWATR